MQKKLDWLKISPVVKNLQFLSNQAEIQAILPTHELFILTKFHKDRQKIVDSLVIVKFRASLIFFCISLYPDMIYLAPFLHLQSTFQHYLMEINLQMLLSLMMASISQKEFDC